MGYVNNPNGQKEASKRWYEKKKNDQVWLEYRRKQQRDNRKKNPELYRATARKHHARTYRKHIGICPLCNFEGKLVWDHNHQTEQFRAWICRPCNGILGFAKDNIQTLKNCVSYLEQHGTRESK